MVSDKSEEVDRRAEMQQGTFPSQKELMLWSVAYNVSQICTLVIIKIATLLSFLMPACESKFNHETSNQFKVSYKIIGSMPMVRLWLKQEQFHEQFMDTLKLLSILFCMYFIICVVCSSFLHIPEGVVTMTTWCLFSGSWVWTHLHSLSFPFAVWDGVRCSVAGHGGLVLELLAWIILCILERM